MQSALQHQSVCPWHCGGPFSDSYKRLGWWWHWLGILRLFSKQAWVTQKSTPCGCLQERAPMPYLYALWLLVCKHGLSLVPSATLLKFTHHCTSSEAWSSADGLCQGVLTGQVSSSELLFTHNQPTSGRIRPPLTSISFCPEAWPWHQTCYPREDGSVPLLHLLSTVAPGLHVQL